MSTGILGGGIAGLTIGQEINGDALVIEKENTIGGMARSIHIDDYIFDRGSHIIFSGNQQVLDWMIGQLGNNIQQNRRKTRIYVDGDLVKYPFENDLVSLPKDKRYDCVKGYIDALLKDGKSDPENFGEWILQTFGEGIAEHYMFPYNRKVWCKDPFEMSAHWMKGRVPQPPVEDVIKSSMGIDTEGYTHQLEFYYPKYGGIEAFAQSIADNSSTPIHTSETVTKISGQTDNWVVQTNKDTYQFDTLYNTMPLYTLANLMELPDKVHEAIYNLQSNGAWLIMVGVDGNVKPYSWMYFADPDIYFNRISFPNNFSPNTSPKGKSSILVEITCNREDKIWEMDPEELKKDVIDQLSDADIVSKEEIEFVETMRTPLAYVVYDLDYLDNIKLINDYFDNIGLTNVGRFAEFVYYNMDGVIESAQQKVVKTSPIIRSS